MKAKRDNIVCKNRNKLESDLRFPLLQKPYVVTTFHPVTLEPGSAEAQLEELLAAIASREDLHFLITKSNADTGGQSINERLDIFEKEHSHCHVVASLGIPTINIGDRQRGRIQAESVLNCRPEREDILCALERTCSPDFRKKAAAARNPYGDGNTSGRILEMIKRTLLSGSLDLEKRFYDIHV